jgi:hypothetical protein
MLLVLLALGLCLAIGPATADINGTVQAIPNGSDIQPYNGPIGPDSSLYGLKLAFENLDESFTFNNTEKLEKEINHSDTRIAEVESALAANQTDAADRALELYWQKMNQTEEMLEELNSTAAPPDLGSYGNRSLSAMDQNMTGGGYPGGYNRTGWYPGETGFANALQNLLRQQAALESLLLRHPDNPGLSRAYVRSQDLEQKFAERARLHDTILYGTERNSGSLFSSGTGFGQNLSGYAGNQSWQNFVNNESGQFQGPLNQTGSERHRGDYQGNPGQDKNPQNGLGNGYRNSDNGNQSGPGNVTRVANGNNRDDRFNGP